MAKIDTPFMSKPAESPTLWGRTYLYSPYKGVPPLPGRVTSSLKKKLNNYSGAKVINCTITYTKITI